MSCVGVTFVLVGLFVAGQRHPRRIAVLTTGIACVLFGGFHCADGLGVKRAGIILQSDMWFWLALLCVLIWIVVKVQDWKERRR